MSACTVSCFHSGLPYPEGKCAVCPDRREREAAEYKASIEINLQQSIAIGRLVQERDEARAEVTRWQAIATRAVEALDQSACCDGADEHEMSCSVGRVLELFDAAGSTTTLDEMLKNARIEAAMDACLNCETEHAKAESAFARGLESGAKEAREAAAKCAEREEERLVRLALVALDKAKDGRVSPDHPWRRDAHQHNVSASAARDIAFAIRALAKKATP